MLFEIGLVLIILLFTCIVWENWPMSGMLPGSGIEIIL